MASALEITRLCEELNRYAARLEVRVEARTLELKKAKERGEAILNNSSDAIILVAVDGAIQQTIPRFVELCGYGPDELLDQSLSRVLSFESGESLAEILETIVANSGYRRAEAAVYRQDGSTFPADAAFAAFRRNHETEIVCSLRDISQQKQLERELRSAFERQKELAELKTRFVSTVSHEYRTPLAVIQTSTELLLTYGDRMSQEKQQGHMAKILDNVKRLTNLLDDVIEVNRAEMIGVEFSPEEINLAELCQQIVDDTRQINPKYQVNFHISGNIMPLTGDVTLIRQIVPNLLSNAIKYSPDRRIIDVTLQFQPKLAMLAVKDEGMGIPPDDFDKLFTLFHRARNVGLIQGTGLGLAIVKQAVDAHGGTISVESEIGKGTTFTVTLPL